MEAFLFPMEELWAAGYQPLASPMIPLKGTLNIKPKLSFLLLPSPSDFGSSLFTLSLLFFLALLGTMSAFAASWTQHLSPIHMSVTLVVLVANIISALTSQWPRLGQSVGHVLLEKWLHC